MTENIAVVIGKITLVYIITYVLHMNKINVAVQVQVRKNYELHLSKVQVLSNVSKYKYVQVHVLCTGLLMRLKFHQVAYNGRDVDVNSQNSWMPNICETIRTLYYHH